MPVTIPIVSRSRTATVVRRGCCCVAHVEAAAISLDRTPDSGDSPERLPAARRRFDSSGIFIGPNTPAVVIFLIVSAENAGCARNSDSAKRSGPAADWARWVRSRVNGVTGGCAVTWKGWRICLQPASIPARRRERRSSRPQASGGTGFSASARARTVLHRSRRAQPSPVG